ncbi:hypothetical protein LG943_20165 [Streptomonospora sp. S1-112]|uniref:Uncharacterized protein n=1 Tax=Streptomonospora mangrovi TaxID=2883123 RepID=A0A9X3SF64_9ACTN|nr:hypothetical protein [Streptomonospora mangrovi]MDA0566608.1 hypothetical protein [Streptomonospora mangrovi]
MSDWTWGFEPPDLGTTLPSEILAEIERIATELAYMGHDADQVGKPHRPSSTLRYFPLANGRGFFCFMLAHHLQEIVIVQVTVWK